MNSTELEQDIRTIFNYSKYFYRLKEDNEFLLSELNKISKKDLEFLSNYYGEASEKIKEIRYRIIKHLLNNRLEWDDIENIKKDVANKYDTNILQSWREIFSIVYTLFYLPIKEIIERYLTNIGIYFMEKVGLKNTKVKIQGFDGGQNFGDTRCWIAIYNFYHRSQSTAIQLFINIDSKDFNYGVIDYPNSKDILRKNINYKNLNIEDIINDFKKNKDIIEQNTDEDIENQYIFWLSNNQKLSQSTVSSYKNRLKTTLPKQLKKIHFRTSLNTIFQTQDDFVLEDILVELQNGKLREWNSSSSVSHEASSAVKQYIKFLENNNNDLESNNVLEFNFKRGNMSNQLNPLNQILFGPPGTGKTYNTINKALEIIFENEDKNKNFEITPEDDEKYVTTYLKALKDDDRKALNGIFELYKSYGCISFVTFHQSYGYEEFVEGIKAIPCGKIGNEDGSEMIYDVVPGIFKKIVTLAKNNQYSNTSFKKSKKFKIDASSLNIQARMNQIDNETFRVLKGSKVRKGNTESFNWGEVKEIFIKNAKYEEFDEYYILQEDYDFNSMSASSSVILGRQSNGNTEWKLIEDNPDTDKLKDRKNYILIIDEINRGNISKIFGELITLIEESKRITNEEAVEIILPYSNEPFGVPSNLYIIGTMNTADRSIALMDTALRRRFDFIEMMPDLAVISKNKNLIDAPYKNEEDENDLIVDNINIRLLLKRINQRIEYLYDRDHTIGHAYFISLKNKPNLIELDIIFRNRIIPLLQEYFYDDWEKIRLVLADNQKEENYQFIKIKKDFNTNKLFGSKNEFEFDDEQKVYEINIKAFSERESYKRIYE